MNALTQLLPEGIVYRLGWTLVHFLWEGAAIAVVAAAVLAALRRRSAGGRYVVGCAAMMAMAAAVAVTLWALPDKAGGSGLAGTNGTSVIAATDLESGHDTRPKPFLAMGDQEGEEDARSSASKGGQDARPPGSGSELAVGAPVAPVTPAASAVPATAWLKALAGRLEPYLPWLVVAWLVGTLGLSARLLAGWIWIERIRRRLVEPVSQQWQAAMREIAARLRVSRPVRLLVSTAAQAPMAIGWLRPVILLPVSAMTGLTAEQLRAVLAHELAHIRRHDYLVNIAQSVVETVLFYHPAVWWISGRIRVEREHCCDDAAVAVSGNALSYARALERVEQLRTGPARSTAGSGSRLAVAAAGSGSLLARIRRLVVPNACEPSRWTGWLAGAVPLVMVAGLAVGASLTTTARGSVPNASRATADASVTGSKVGTGRGPTAEPAGGNLAGPDAANRLLPLRGVAWQIRTSGNVVEQSKRQLAEIAAVGADTVLITSPGYQDEVWSDSFRVDPAVTPSTGQWREILKIAHGHHLRVVLMPIILLSHPQQGEWRSKIQPPDWDLWFDQYKEFIMHFARVAADNHVEVLSVGSELLGTERHTERWRKVIQEVRKVYAGKLTYSACWDHYKVVQFWDDLDLIGMTSYYKLSDKPNPTMETLGKNWAPIKQEILDWQKRIGKPLLFTQVGWCSQEGASVEPWNYYYHQQATPAGLAEQRRCYRAFMDTWANVPQVGGIIWWEWTNTAGVADDVSYTPHAKPAEQELRGWFQRLHPATATGPATEAAPPAATQPANIDDGVHRFARMVGTWYFDNPEGDAEQMAVFPDGRVVVLYSNGHKDETRYEDGVIKLAEYDGWKARLQLISGDRLLETSVAPPRGLAKIFERIDRQPKTNLLRPLTGPARNAPTTKPAGASGQATRPVPGPSSKRTRSDRTPARSRSGL